MKFQQLAVTGCGYMQGYAHGHGHVDLANRLEIPNSVSLTLSDSSNERLIRTVHDHSLNNQPTFYVIGLTFLGRWDLAMRQNPFKQEGRWISFQNTRSIANINETVLTQQEFELLTKIKIKTEQFSIEDRVWDLALKLRTLVDSLKYRGHGCVIFNTAEDLILPWLDDESNTKILSVPEIVQGLKWLAVPYQFDNGVAVSIYDQGSSTPPQHKHTNPGEHQVLNDFLQQYIENNIFI